MEKAKKYCIFAGLVVLIGIQYFSPSNNILTIQLVAFTHSDISIIYQK